MSTKPNKLDSLSEVRREELVADIMRGELSWRSLSSKYGIAQSSLRLFADRHQIQRNPTGAKREMVAAKMALPDRAVQPPAQDAAHVAGKAAHRAEGVQEAPKSDLEAAADEDTRDMRYALQAARMALNIAGKKLTTGLARPEQLSPRDLKSLSETLRLNTDTIRVLRGLDAPPPDMTDWSDDELEAAKAGKL